MPLANSDEDKGWLRRLFVAGQYGSPPPSGPRKVELDAPATITDSIAAVAALAVRERSSASRLQAGTMGTGACDLVAGTARILLAKSRTVEVFAGAQRTGAVPVSRGHYHHFCS